MQLTIRLIIQTTTQPIRFNNISLLLRDTKIERDKKNYERGFRRTKTVNGVIGDPINEYQYRQDIQIHQGS